MKAYVRIDSESQEVKLTEMEVPQLNDDQVLIEVRAFGVGIHDRYFIPAQVDFPYIIGSEGAGIIRETGKNVTNYEKGEKVIFTTILQNEGGSWAEYAVANQDVLIKLPKELSFEEGATIPIAGKTAMECIRELNLNIGDYLFIAGASGAIGTLVIQMAAAQGVHVAASASSKNHEYKASLGAEKTVDYRDRNWIEQVRQWSKNGVTAGLAIQPGTGEDSIKVVKDGGLLITVSGDNTSVVPERNITVRQMGHHQNSQQRLAELANRMAKGEIKVFIENIYSFEQALDALKKTETRHARGKSVVKINKIENDQ